MERMKIILEYRWEPVARKDGAKYLFPDERGSIEGSYWRPAVYRWYAHKPGERSRYYIGEAQNLRERVYGYLNAGPTQQTNKWMNQSLTQLIQEGFTVGLEVLEDLKLGIDEGQEFSKKDLESKHFRRAIECLMLSIAERNGDMLLNK